MWHSNIYTTEHCGDGGFILCLEIREEPQAALLVATSGGSDWPRTFWCGWIRPVNSCHWPRDMKWTLSNRRGWRSEAHFMFSVHFVLHCFVHETFSWTIIFLINDAGHNRLFFLLTVCVVSLCLQRLERQTRLMDQTQYSDFCESRQLSFGEI